ncbi:MAG: phosphotransferase family protein [Mycobacteriaceae bacterium]|nr:phosphotransferase family protein [Mycobacteriaceae bacterium]
MGSVGHTMAVQSSLPSALSASLRDPDGLRAVVERWLGARQAGAAVAVARLIANHTVLVDAGWGGQAHRLVVRISSSDPVESRCHYLTLRRLGTQLVRPTVPSVLWSEDDPGPLGAPFFVMTRLDGLTTAKYETPYTFGSWITEASAADRRRMQRATLEQLARVHAAVPADFAFLDRRRPGESALSARVRQTAERYESVGSRGLRAPLIERGFAWLQEHWPHESAPVLCWGDARIDNAVYRDFESAALLGWQHATLGPRELDLGALILRHRFADSLAHAAGCPGLPDFLRPNDVTAAYADITGHRVVDLGFYITYAALQLAVEMLRRPLRNNAFRILDEALQEEN